MIPLFEDDKQWEKLLEVLSSWEGTPYRHLQMVKGRGADCALFLGAVLLEAKVLEGVSYDYYSKDWFMHTDHELIIDGIIRHLKDNVSLKYKGKVLRKPKFEDLVRGDVVGFSTVVSGATNHASMYLGGKRMMHSVYGRTVSETQFGNYWKQKITATFRIMK